MISGANYITAHFIDNERKNIEVILKDDDETKVYPYILEYNPDNPICKELLKVCSLDELHENTWEKKKVERKDFESMVKRVAQKEGLIKKIIESIDSEFMTLMMDFLLSGKQEHIDRLFNFKIFLFEQDIVKHAEENKKTAIRKSKTPLEALKIFIQIWEENK
tara:strand:- start:18 stop:506 length:489 start_codon:yes stop_codon:yes gene_type:complete